MTYDQKRELCSAKVTLNGKPAVICGARQEFAMVRQLDAEGIVNAEFAWPTVQRIVAAGGRFKA